MSFGKKDAEDVRALEAEGNLPSGLRAGEASARILDKLQQLGHAPRELPHPRTIIRHLDRLGQLPSAVDATCPVCHSKFADADGISDGEPADRHQLKGK